MKISIDTREDTHDDIRKVIKMLQHLVGEPVSSSSSLIDNPTPESATLFNMFQEPSVPANPPTEEEKREAVRNMDSNPEIIPY